MDDSDSPYYSATRRKNLQDEWARPPRRDAAMVRICDSHTRPSKLLWRFP